VSKCGPTWPTRPPTNLSCASGCSGISCSVSNLCVGQRGRGLRVLVRMRRHSMATRPTFHILARAVMPKHRVQQKGFRFNEEFGMAGEWGDLNTNSVYGEDRVTECDSGKVSPAIPRVGVAFEQTSQSKTTYNRGFPWERSVTRGKEIRKQFRLEFPDRSSPSFAAVPVL